MVNVAQITGTLRSTLIQMPQKVSRPWAPASQWSDSSDPTAGIWLGAQEGIVSVRGKGLSLCRDKRVREWTMADPCPENGLRDREGHLTVIYYRISYHTNTITWNYVSLNFSKSDNLWMIHWCIDTSKGRAEDQTGFSFWGRGDRYFQSTNDITT